MRYYRAPSVKSLMRIEGMGIPNAKLIRDMIHGGNVPVTAETNGEGRCERILHHASIAFGGYGVESVWDKRYGDANNCYGFPVAMYINMGQTYDATLIFDLVTDTFRVGCQGDLAERYQLTMKEDTMRYLYRYYEHFGWALLQWSPARQRWYHVRWLTPQYPQGVSHETIHHQLG